VQLARVIGSSMSRIAEAVVAALRLHREIPQHSRGMPYLDIVREFTAVSTSAYPVLIEVLDTVLRRHIVTDARRQWEFDAERPAVTVERAVGFADLVGFTTVANTLEPDELTDLLERFETTVSDVLGAAGGRVVKTIGDEVMFVLDDPGSACSAGLRIVEAVGMDDRLPAVRVGVGAGRVLSYGGDHFGTPVNLAARLVKLAGEGVLADEHAALANRDDTVTVEPLEPQIIKGFERAIPAYTIRRRA
jgi:class 3 adenylate cyclase